MTSKNDGNWKIGNYTNYNKRRNPYSKNRWQQDYNNRNYSNSPRKSPGYTRSQVPYRPRPNIRNSFSLSPGNNKGWSSTPISNYNNNNNNRNELCNSNVTNLSFNENDFMSSTAYKTNSNRRSTWRTRHYNVARNRNSTFDDSSFTQKTINDSKHKENTNRNVKKANDRENETKNQRSNDEMKKNENTNKDSVRKIKLNAATERAINAKRQNYKEKEIAKKKPLKSNLVSNKNTERIKSCDNVSKDKDSHCRISNNFTLNFIIDPQASAEELSKDTRNQSDYICRKNLKFPNNNLENLNMKNIDSVVKKNSVTKSLKMQANPRKLFEPGFDKFASVPDIVSVKKDTLGHELEIFEDDDSSIRNGSLIVSNICNSSHFSTDLGQPVNKVIDIKLKDSIIKDTVTVIPPTCSQTKVCDKDDNVIVPPTQSQTKKVCVKDKNMIVPPTQSQTVCDIDDDNVIVPPTQSQTKVCVNKDKNMIVPPTQSQTKVCINKDNVIAPPTQSQSLTPSVSIPCGQKIEVEDFLSPKKEAEYNVEHYLNSFFSQISPPILSQVIDPIRKSQESTSNLVSIVPSVIESIAIGIDSNTKLSVSSSPIKSLPKSSTVDNSNKSGHSSFQSHNNDGDIIPSSQINVSSSCAVPDIQSMKILSTNISKKSSTTTSFNASPNCSQDTESFQEDINNSYLDSYIPPLTSTQISKKNIIFHLPDVSPLFADRQISAVNHNDKLKRPDVQEHSTLEPHLVNKILKQKPNTLVFQIKSDNMLTYNTSVNDSIDDLYIGDFEAIKIKMEELFNVDDSQNTREFDSLETSNIEHRNEANETEFVEKHREDLIARENRDSSPEIQMLPSEENREVEITYEGNKVVKTVDIDIDTDKENEDIENYVNTDKENEDTENYVDSDKENEDTENYVDTDKKNEDTENYVDTDKENEDTENYVDTDKENEDNENYVDTDKENEDTENYVEKNRAKEMNEKDKAKKMNKKLIYKEKQHNKRSIENEEHEIQTSADKENQNPEILKRKFIEEFESKVEDVVRKIRDICEKKKKKYLQYNTQTQFEIRIKDIEGTNISKERIEFTLQDDEQENVALGSLSVSVKCKSDKDERETSTQPFKVVKDVPMNRCEDNDENIKKITEEKKKKKKPKKTDLTFMARNNWWEAYTGDIPKSIFENNNKVQKDSDKPSTTKECIETPACGNSKTRKLDEDNETESSSRKKLKKAKKLKKSKEIEEDLIDAVSENETEPIIPIETSPEATNHKKKKKRKESKEECDDDSTPKVTQGKRYKKEFSKTLNKFYKKNKALTPPFQFQKLESQPGRKRPLLSNLHHCGLLDT